MNTKILGLSGKKQSGKNTSANYIVGCFIKSLGISKDFTLNNGGNIVLTDIFGEQIPETFNILSEANVDFRKEYLDDIVKLYSYADVLKELCIEILGLTYNQCYGTDEEKSSPTNLLWEHMPGVYTNKELYRLVSEAVPDLTEGQVSGRLGHYYTKSGPIVYHDPGYMTGRDVMQYVGTEVFRRMYDNVWANATINKILKDRPLLAIITDVRFENEVATINNINIPNVSGRVIRLLRNVNGNKDQHASEIALDNYPHENFFAVIDNTNMSIEEQNQTLDNILRQNINNEESWLPVIGDIIE